MSQLPDWVLEYKTKGIYTKKTKTGYALYKGHSERVPGKKYPVFRCDEYLGIVSEKDGLVPSKPPVKAGIKVLRYGFCRIAETSCNMLKKTPKRLTMNMDILFVKAVLGFEGMETQQGYEGSWLSILYPRINMNQSLTEQEERFLLTLRRQIDSKIKDRFGLESEDVLTLSANLYAVHVNGSWHLSDISKQLKNFAAKHAISLELGGEYHGV